MKKVLCYLACLCGIAMSFISCDPNGASNEITIYGNVIDRTTGQPLYNVLIQEKNKVGGSTVTGNDGNYEFTLPLNGSSDGKYYLVASKDKYSSSEYELNMSSVDKNRRVKVDFQLTKESITYTGIVLDSKNNPIFDAHISAQFSSASGSGTDYNIGSTTMTDANGKYTLELPRPHKSNSQDYPPYDQWKFAITATKNGYHDLTHTLNQNVDDMGKTITLNFILNSSSIIISGKVVDQNGQPIAYANVSDEIFSTGTWNSEYGYYYNLKGSKRLSSTQTDVNGNYTISSVGYMSVNGYVSRNHEFTCEKEGYITQYRYLTTSESDGGNSYNVDFKLKIKE
ncbi:MAG: carboxypeptidase regulatory-like domain-containing protein [Paludibacteraceae bacterium]|nr:carboxypeptidase regulatory-like domain-containing protein [Paludibacteraceae bacterium]